MKRFSKANIFACLLTVASAFGLHEFEGLSYPTEEIRVSGDKCQLPDGLTGVCTPYDACHTATAGGNLHRHIICSYQQYTPVICCHVVSNQQWKGEGTESTQKNKVGERAKRACERNLQFPQIPGSRFNNAGISSRTQPVLPMEFPFIVAIGFGKENKIVWRCSGALISSRFVLSVGHCVATRRHGAARWILLGTTDPHAHTQTRTVIRIAERHAHPGFAPPSLYDDIALLELEREVQMSAHVRPTCLWTGGDLLGHIGEVGQVMGWELRDWIVSNGSSHLMRVSLSLRSQQDCVVAYEAISGGPRLKHGFDDKNMVCVRGLNQGTDVCERDTGGMFMLPSPEYPGGGPVVAAIMLFGKTICGGVNTPAIALQLWRYLPWIESVVWP